MRVVVVGLAVWSISLLGVVGLVPRAYADIYLFRDQLGVLHFTNAPAGPSRVVVKEKKGSAKRPSRYFVSGAPVAPWPMMASASEFDPLIREIAQRYDVEYALVKAVIKAESGFDRTAVSPKGALGLMQLMPQTAALHQVRNVFMPRENIEGGVRHLRMLLDRYGGNLPLAIAAYNAGAQRVEEAGGVPRILETREYLARVLRYRQMYLREAAGVLEVRR